MTDLLSHVLVAYAAVTLASVRIDRLDDAHVPVAMVGAVVPDLSKLHLLVPHAHLEALLGVPFSWLALHRLGGVLVVVAAGAALFEPGERRVAGGLLLFGAGSHLLLDAMIQRAHGLAPPYLYPLSWWRPPAGGVYVSADLWPSALAVAAAGLVWYARRSRG